MVPDSKLTRGLIYCLVIIQSSIAPISFLYYAYYMFTEKKFELGIIDYWLGCEVLFYIYFKLTCNRFQKIQTIATLNTKERYDLYQLCLSTIHQPEWITEWFYNIVDQQHPSLDQLYRDNVAEWLSWAFFSSTLTDVLKDDTLTKELTWMIDQFENEFHLEFKAGYNTNIISFRLNLDPIHANHRPFIMYLVILLASTFFSYICQFYWNMKRLNTGKLFYWYRKGNTNKTPIVFIHGIGAGLMCYTTFISNLLHSIDAPVFFVELPYVSMQFEENVPSMQETVHDLQAMLKHHQVKDAVFISHSLGTAVTAWALKHMPKSVAGVIFIDPICFMLHYRDVCFNFVYRTPKTAAECLVKYFASSELYISHYISRHFNWFQNALFVQPNIPHRHTFYSQSVHMPKNTKVYLSEKDTIVNSFVVDSYLVHHGIDSVIMKGLDHASFLLDFHWQNDIIDTVYQFIKL